MQGAFPFDISTFLMEILSFYSSIKSSDKGSRYGIKKGSFIHSHKSWKEIFPKTKFVCLIRDGRATFNSQRKTISSEGKILRSDPRIAAERWKIHVNLTRDIEILYPNDVLVVHYETMIKDFSSTLSQIGDFLHLAPINGESSYTANVSYYIPERYKHIHENVNKAPMTSRIDKWRENLSEEEINIIEQVAGRELESEGYNLTARRN